MKYHIAALLISFTLFTPSISHAAEELNAGFVQGLWYATPTIFASEPTRIYVALRNHTDRDLTGTVRFTDNGKRIGVSYVSALPGRLVEAWVDWTPAYGEHAITATLSEVQFHSIGESGASAEVVSMLAEDTVFVDYDTDGDTIGNITDTDDDNDTLLDTTEAKNGTDPLVATPIKNVAAVSDAVTREPTSSGSGSSKKEASTEAAGTEQLAQASISQGLETYTEDGGTIDNLLSNVTEKVTTAKVSVDTYREKRADAIAPYFNKGSETATSPIESAKETLENTPPSEIATITRSKIAESDEGFLYAMIEGGKALIGGFYTLILFGLSSVLAHPMFIQLGLLFGIVYIIYRVARKFGKRPGH